MKLKNQGQIVIISSPSGGGKTSICRKLLQKNKDWSFSVSYTTREKRKGERHGKEYFFTDPGRFKQLIGKNFFSEHFKVHLYNYGTPRKPLEDTVKKGGVILLDVDTQGAFRLKKEYPTAITLFILPPSISALKKRLSARGTETKVQLKIRYENAAKEMKLWHKFEYVVVNDTLTEAVNKVLAIIKVHPCRSKNIDKEQIRKIIG